MEEDRKSFQYIFENVIWYHYKWAIIAGVFVIAVAVFMFIDASHKVRYDFSMVVATGSQTVGDLSGLEKLVADAVGDVNGDGQVNISIQTVNAADQTASTGNETRMFAYLATEDYFLFILDKEYSDAYTKLEYFDPLSAYGIQPDTDGGARVKVNDTGVFKRAGLGDEDLYACLMDRTTAGKGKQETLDASVRVMRAILAS